jgi:outer membrane protein assembly factor BamB
MFSTVIIGNYLYGLNLPLNLTCFNTETNSILWRHDFPIPKNQKDYESGRIVIYNSKIYIATTKGKIYCME